MSTDESKTKEIPMEYRLLGGTGLKVSVFGFGSMTFNTLEQAQSMMKAARKIGINFFDNAGKASILCHTVLHMRFLWLLALHKYGNIKINRVVRSSFGQCRGLFFFFFLVVAFPCNEKRILTTNIKILFGKALKNLQSEDATLWRRSDLVITTKLFFGPNPTLTENRPGIVYGKIEVGTSRKHLLEGVDASLKRLQLDYVDVIYAHRHDPTTPILETVRAFTQIIEDGKAFYWGTSMWPAIKILEA
ncbi:hypothetical protein RFI_00042 [Reticulomyxa filosa]|uniref:NADP-dependent oxidoreductase domain-containing protein n=1 Tax=Reticulomyxa filosa TaxID=46433 RepID=X6PG66_RETFI|nr:hypothetical protein RFI_00042 [Reticulomyxa filosa]|eukprot:ETO37019.1 hypothetical protein RFI_00042 [Reticulomyxa filosa]